MLEPATRATLGALAHSARTAPGALRSSPNKACLKAAGPRPGLPGLPRTVCRLPWGNVRGIWGWQLWGGGEPLSLVRTPPTRSPNDASQAVALSKSALCGPRAVGPHSSAASVSARWRTLIVDKARGKSFRGKASARGRGTKAAAGHKVSVGRAPWAGLARPLPRGTFLVTSWYSHLRSSRALLRFRKWHLAERGQIALGTEQCAGPCAALSAQSLGVATCSEAKKEKPQEGKTKNSRCASRRRFQSSFPLPNRQPR